MVETDLKLIENELNEILYFFDGGADLSVRHLFSEKENKVVNTIVVGGKSYAYGNLLGNCTGELERKRLIKRYAKLSLYKAISAFTGEVLPWGALAGVRPTKLAYQQIKENGEFKNFFTETMKVSERKTVLIEKILYEQEGIYTIDDDNTDFYVSIPFCPSRCRYCSFISQDIKTAEKYLDAYVDALIKDVEYSAKFIKKLRSIYIGGGTPVSLSDERLERILCAINKINSGVEYTVEAGRPDRITKENLEMLKSHGVTRICINPQTFNDKTLERIGRNHTSKDIICKYELARGKFIINMDLIAGLDGENFADFKKSVDTAIELSPENITVHTLSVKKGSYLAEDVKLLKTGEINEMVDYAHEILDKNGYNPYYVYRQKYMAGSLENTGYCKKGTRCVYNIDVMEEISRNIACGAGSVNKEVKGGGEFIDRYGLPKDVKTYVEKIDKILEEKEEFFKQNSLQR